MADPSTVSVVIPAFHEEGVIGEVIQELRAIAPWKEILVVDDGSADATGERARAAGARVIRHPYNKGNGAAVKTGIRAAQGEVVLLMDGDGQHAPADALRIVSRIGEYDMVIGARSPGDQSGGRALANGVFNAFASFLSERRVLDLTSGFRAARREMLLEILYLLPNGFSYPTTSCLSFLKAGWSVAFEPIHAKKRVGSSKIRPLQDGVKFLLIILKIVTLYSPLKVFVPVSALLFVPGAAYGLWNVVFHDKIPMGAGLLMQAGVLAFLFGLISEQIASTRGPQAR